MIEMLKQWGGRARHTIYKRIAPISYARWIGVQVGDDCRLIDASFSTEPYLVTLGDHVSATKVRFETHDGGVWVFRKEMNNIDVVKPIVVGNNVFIGFGSLILPGSVIGDNVVIGAGSIVSGNIPSNTVAVGSPARVIRQLDDYRAKVVASGAMTKGLSPLEKRLAYTSHRDGGRE